MLVHFFRGIEGIDKDPTTFYVESLVRDGKLLGYFMNGFYQDPVFVIET